MAHGLNYQGSGHDAHFYRALMKEAQAEWMTRAVVAFEGRNAKKALKALKAEAVA